MLEAAEKATSLHLCLSQRKEQPHVICFNLVVGAGIERGFNGLGGCCAENECEIRIQPAESCVEKE